MLGIVIYLIIQVALAGFTLHIVVNREEIRAKNAHRKDKPWEKIIIVVLIPLMAFAYSLLGGYPPKSDQLVFMTVFTAGMYGAMILRWRRQARIGMPTPEKALERRYYYRSTDGKSVCGPDPEVRLHVLARMGLINQGERIKI